MTGIILVPADAIITSGDLDNSRPDYTPSCGFESSARVAPMSNTCEMSFSRWPATIMSKANACVRARAGACVVQIKVATVAFCARACACKCVIMVRARLFGLLRVSLPPPKKKKKNTQLRWCRRSKRPGALGVGVGKKDTVSKC